MTDMTMGQRIAERRKKIDLSQEALGEKLGVSRQAISKWESDGAVPEIDKLIALSKLFGVSVGWLLGIEESAAPQEDGLSEKQIRMVQEIAEQYQPLQYEMPQFRWVFAIPIFAVSLAVLVWAFSWSFRQASIAAVEEQCAGWHASQVQDIAALQSQINDLYERLEGSGSTSGAPREVTLDQYTFEVEKAEDGEAAMLRFHGIPSRWHEDYQAVLVVEHGGEEYIRQQCAWTGSGLHATLKMDIQNGYNYYLLVEFPEGAREQTVLFDRKAENIRQVFTILVEVNHGGAEFDLRQNTMYLSDYEIHIEPPLTSGARNPVLTGGSLVLFLERGGEIREADRFSLFGDQSTSPGNGPAEELSAITCYPQGPLTFPEPEEGDRLELWVSVSGSDDLEEKQMLGTWVYTHGEFIANTSGK